MQAPRATCSASDVLRERCGPVPAIAPRIGLREHGAPRASCSAIDFAPRAMLLRERCCSASDVAPRVMWLRERPAPQATCTASNVAPRARCSASAVLHERRGSAIRGDQFPVSLYILDAPLNSTAAQLAKMHAPVNCRFHRNQFIRVATSRQASVLITSMHVNRRIDT